ncbi:MAG TPA: endonuclease [Candidatus Diapherotrites archaeon]|uniref:Endonuclease n=1 Tax=Candidatus Iainarchaeum sp. TaxID=3101447 RepID=A0A7J4JG36_9ARCH|nr:endonuclease [Candidatus Diapherotrites archaeon]
MDFTLVLVAFILLLLVALAFLYSKLVQLQSELAELSFSKSSQSVKYGKLTEQWIPFTKDFPYSPEQFRFIGTPIDGLVFADDKIVFCEFKAASSQLSDKQKRVKELVEAKAVDWLEYRIK